ncbi:hypothetical protein QBC44DRAFT_309356 [Cladorrhinum sp. PSN332]|nr:hypothetical protein QBC44DRAFT_309356 [Cladorrhinum sp. PSN332]
MQLSKLLILTTSVLAHADTVYTAPTDKVAGVVGNGIQFTESNSTTDVNENGMAFCQATPGTYQVSSASPLAKDCLELRDKIDAKPFDWRVSVQYKYHKIIIHHKSCAFGISPKTGLTRIDLTRRDVLDLFTDTISRLQTALNSESEAKVGAKGDIYCYRWGKDRWRGTWALYKTPPSLDDIQFTATNSPADPKPNTGAKFTLYSKHGSSDCTYENGTGLWARNTPFVEDCEKMRDSIPDGEKRYEAKAWPKGYNVAHYGTCVLRFDIKADTMVTSGKAVRDLIDTAIRNHRYGNHGDIRTKVAGFGSIFCGEGNVESGRWSIDTINTATVTQLTALPSSRCDFTKKYINIFQFPDDTEPRVGVKGEVWCEAGWGKTELEGTWGIYPVSSGGKAA